MATNASSPTPPLVKLKGAAQDSLFEAGEDLDPFPRVKITAAGNVFVGNGSVAPATDLAAGGGVAGVSSFNTRTGAVVLTTADAQAVLTASTLPESTVTNLTTDLASKATDSLVVHLAGAETVTGVKTFSAAPVVPASSFPESAVTNLTTDLAAKVPLATVTSVGDLIVGTGAGAVGRVGIGTAGQVATVAGGTVTWATPSSGFTNPMTTAGDIIIENATPAPARLPIGTTAQVLTVVAGLPAWSAPQVTAVDCIVSTTTFSLPTSALTTVPFPSTTDDPFSMHSNTVNNTRITIPAGQAGVYVVSGANQSTTNVTGGGRFFCVIQRNGVQSVFGTEEDLSTLAAAFPGVSVTGLFRLAVGDFIELNCFQASGATLTCTASLTVVKVGL